MERSPLERHDLASFADGGDRHSIPACTAAVRQSLCHPGAIVVKLVRCAPASRVPPMCNKYRSRLAIDALLGGFPDLRTPKGLPNLEPRDEISITDAAPIIQLDDEGAPSLAQMRWSWPGPRGKPVYNFRSEGRRFASGCCLIPVDGFYEFTDPSRRPRSGRARPAGCSR